MTRLKTLKESITTTFDKLSLAERVELPFAADGFKHCLKHNYRILEDVTDKGGTEDEKVSVNSFGANLPTMEPGVFGLGIAKKALFDNWFKLHKTGTYVATLCKTKPKQVSHRIVSYFFKKCVTYMF
eukprot:g5360.t1